MVTMLSLKTILVSETLPLNTPQLKDVMFEKSMDIKLVHPSKNPSQFVILVKYLNSLKLVMLVLFLNIVPTELNKKRDV